MASTYIDGNNIRKNLLPRLNEFIKSASFAPNRFRVQRVFVCAAVISQDEEVIHEILTTMPAWSTTQENLDWQPDDERRSAGDVYQHLMTMSSSARDCPKPDEYLCKEVESLNNSNSICSHSFRLSTFEVCNAAVPNLGYHIGATALQKLPGFESKNEECELWTKLFFQYLIEKDDDSPGIIWAGRRVPTAVVWQVQLDIVDTWLRRRPSYEQKRKGQYGPFGQVPELEAPPEKQHKGVQSPRRQKGDCKSEYKGVRYRQNRGSWMAETRLPAEEQMKNKVSFGDYKSDYEAARAVDAARYYYRKGSYNFPDSPELLKIQPSLEGLEGKEKRKAVKDRAKWFADNAPHPSTSPPSSPVPTAETIASPGFSRSDSRESDESDGIILDHMIVEPFEFQASDDQCEERTHSSFTDVMSLLFDESFEAPTPSSTESFMLSTALYPPYDWCNQISWDACATQSTSQVSQVSQDSIVAGSRL